MPERSLPYGRAGAIIWKRSSALLLLLGLCLVAFLFQGNRGVFESTEGRYSSVASEMIRLDDWLVPHLDEETPHFTKPPLTYWVLAGSIQVFGRNEWALRVPGAVAFMLTTLVLLRAGKLMVPKRPLLAAVIYSSFLLPATASNIISTDNLLTLAEVAAMVAFAEHCFGRDSSSIRPAALGWLFLSLAFLTKGYPAVLPFLALLTFHILRGRSLSYKSLQVPAGLAIFAVVGAAWFVVVIWRDPDLLRYFVGEELIGRMAGQHERNPEWYKAITVYGPVLLLGTFPWTLHAGRAFVGVCRSSGRILRGAKAGSDNGSAIDLFLFLWLLVPIVVFLFARSRLELYLLPQFAPLAILSARFMSSRAQNNFLVETLAGVGIVTVLAVRFVAGQIYSDDNSRHLAQQISDLPGSTPREIVFVEEAPYRGVAFYLAAEVEHVVFSQATAEAMGTETVQEELGDYEAGRIWLVPKPLESRFRDLAEDMGFELPTEIGTATAERSYVAFLIE